MSEQVETALALALKWSRRDVRHLMDELEAQGVFLVYQPTTGELCPCGYHYATESGLCVKCETERKLDEQRRRDEEEEARLAAEAIKAENAQKKQRQRMREEYGANPRKGARR